MADTYLTLSPTPDGRNMIARSLYGDTITFTKIVIGNGTPADPDNVTELANPLLEIQLTAAEPSEDEDYMLLTGYVTSSDIEASFYGYEIGVIAEDSDENEHLFGYRYNAQDVDYYPDASSGRALELTITVVVQLGNAQNVTAILIEGDTYATKAEFDAHTNSNENPHHVTKTQVGLGDVPNVATNDQEPTYSAAATLSALVSGEKLSVAFGKIAKAVSALISHLTATNPHNTTAADIGAAPASHTHSAADINSGTLSAARGGTGSNTLYGSDLAKVRTATLTSNGWSGSVPYTQAVTVTGITANDAPIISAGAPATMNAANYATLIKNFAMIDRAVTAANKITFYCYRKKPTANIPLYIKGV